VNVSFSNKIVQNDCLKIISNFIFLVKEFSKCTAFFKQIKEDKLTNYLFRQHLKSKLLCLFQTTACFHEQLTLNGIQFT